MQEKIEVGYTPAAVVGGAGIYHKYILYTNSEGQQFYVSRLLILSPPQAALIRWAGCKSNS